VIFLFFCATAVCKKASHGTSERSYFTDRCVWYELFCFVILDDMYSKPRWQCFIDVNLTYRLYQSLVAFNEFFSCGVAFHYDLCVEITLSDVSLAERFRSRPTHIQERTLHMSIDAGRKQWEIGGVS